MWPEDAPALPRQVDAVARFAQEHPLRFATSSGAQIAALTGSSEASVARAARRLGFENVKEMKASCASRVQEMADLQGVLRGRLEALDTGGGGSPASDGSGVAGSMPLALRAAANLVLGVEESVHWQTASAVARDLGEASRVIVFGLGTAHCLAQYAEIEFARLGLDARAITGSGHTNAHAVFQVAVDDVVLVLAPRVIFPDVERFATAAIERARAVHLMTQASLPPRLSAAGVPVLRLPSSSGSGATDAVATVALIDALVAEVARQHPQRSIQARTLAQTYRDEFSR